MSSSSSHRLPTISASHALQKLRNAAPSAISTGLPRLDAILSHQRGSTSSQSISWGGGLVRGQVTQVHGPPGVGKTAFCIQASVSAINAGDKVVWIDTSTPLVFTRLDEVLGSAQDLTTESSPKASTRSSPAVEQRRKRFYHYAVPTLPHLLALLLHQRASFLPVGTSLIVIDSISTPFENAYLRTHDDRSSKQSDATKWAAGRKYAVMGELISKLGKMAAVNNVAILITSQTITRMRSGLSALLLPAISASEWDNGIHTQLVLFRDWPPRRSTQNHEDADRWSGLRYAGAIKVKGDLAVDEGRFETVVPFSIEKEGLVELSTLAANVTVPILSSPTQPAKRRFDQVADSEDEEPLSEDDYGWDPDDELAASLLESEELFNKKVSTQTPISAPAPTPETPNS